MSTLIEHTWTAANNTLWTEETWARVYPNGTLVAGGEAIIFGNKGNNGSVAVAKIYRSLFYPALRDYKFTAVLTWANAAGTGRKLGLGARVNGTGEGYYAEFDSNVGVARCRLIRRLGTTDTDLSGWVTLTGIDPGDLDAGLTVGLRIQNDEEGVNLVVSAAGTDYIEDSDPFVTGQSIDGGGTVGVYFPSTGVNDDIQIDDLIVTDFEDEAPTSAYQAGIGLMINGVYYNETQWKALNLSPLRCRISYSPQGPVGLIEDLNDVTEPFLRPGMWIRFIYNNVALAEGLIHARNQSFPPPESISYELTGPRELGFQVPITDPIDGAPFIAFNQDPDADYYIAARADKTIGEMLAFLWDNHEAGDDGLRAKGAGPSSGPLYDEDDLDALDAKVPNVIISGSVTSAEETLLAFMPEFAIRIDPVTRIRRVIQRSGSSAEGINTNAHHLLADLSLDISRNKTAVLIRGSVPEAEDTTLSYDPLDPGGSSLVPTDNWNKGGWRADKAFANENTTAVTGNGVTGGGRVYIDVTVDDDFEMEASEWKRAMLTFQDGPEVGNFYFIWDNTTTRIEVNATSWQSGGPDNGDIARVFGSDDPEARDGAFVETFRTFKSADGLHAGDSFCGFANVRNKNGKRVTIAKVKTQIIKRIVAGITEDHFKLDLPAISLINRFLDGGTDTCTDGGAETLEADGVEIDVPLFENAAVPTLRVPEEGFRGTAYSFDTDKWNGGGEPNGDDYGWKDILTFEIPDFQQPALQAAEYTKMADAILAVYGTAAVQGAFTFGGEILTQYVTLDRRIQFSDGAGGRTTGLESSTDIWVMEAEWIFTERDTILRVGNQASNGIDLEAFRKRYAEKTRLDSLRRTRKLLDEMRNCMKDSFHGGGYAGGESPFPVPGCNVTSGIDGESVHDSIERHEKITKITEGNKKLTEGFAVNDDGSITDANDDTWFPDDDGNWHFGAVDGPIGTPLVGGLIGGLLHNNQKTVDNDTGEVVAPGTVLGAGGGTHYNGDGTFTSIPPGGTAPGSLAALVAANKALMEGLTVNADGTVTDGAGQKFRVDGNGFHRTGPDVTPSGTGVQPGGMIGGLMANGGKTGLMLKEPNTPTPPPPPGAPNSAVPADHAGIFTHPNGTITYLDEGDTVPATVTSIALNTLRALTGFNYSDAGMLVDVISQEFIPTYDGMFVPKTMGVVTGPVFGGAVGGLCGNAGKTLHGAAAFGSGPGTVLTPGDTVDEDLAYYYPPTEDGTAILLAEGDIVPASVTRQNLALAGLLGLTPVALGDAGGVVYTDGTNFWRVTPDGTQFKRVDYTAGTGLNGGDYSWHDPEEFYSPQFGETLDDIYGDSLEADYPPENMFTDAEGTTRATETEDLVRLWRDRKGNHDLTTWMNEVEDWTDLYDLGLSAPGPKISDETLNGYPTFGGQPWREVTGGGQIANGFFQDGFDPAKEYLLVFLCKTIPDFLDFGVMDSGHYTRFLDQGLRSYVEMDASDYHDNHFPSPLQLSITHPGIGSPSFWSFIGPEANSAYNGDGEWRAVAFRSTYKRDRVCMWVGEQKFSLAQQNLPADNVNDDGDPGDEIPPIPRIWDGSPDELGRWMLQYQDKAKTAHIFIVNCSTQDPTDDQVRRGMRFLERRYKQSTLFNWLPTVITADIVHQLDEDSWGFPAMCQDAPIPQATNKVEGGFSPAQATEANQPVIDREDDLPPGGQRVAKFDGSNDYLEEDDTPTSAGNPVELYIVAKVAAGSPFGLVSTYTGTQELNTITGDFYSLTTAGGDFDASEGDATEWALVHVTYDGVNTTLRYVDKLFHTNGVDTDPFLVYDGDDLHWQDSFYVVEDDSGAPGAVTGLDIGRAGGVYLNGRIAMVLRYIDKTDGDVDDILGGGRWLGFLDAPGRLGIRRQERSAVERAIAYRYLTVHSTLGGSGLDHGALEGLGDDDHTIYALADGTRGAFEPEGAVADREIPVGPFLLTAPVSNTSAQVGGYGMSALGTDFVPTRAGQLVGISAHITGGITLGSATIKISKNGTPSGTLVLALSSASAYNTGSGVTFAAGDKLEASIDTDTLFNGTGTLSITFYLQFD